MNQWILLLAVVLSTSFANAQTTDAAEQVFSQEQVERTQYFEPIDENARVENGCRGCCSRMGLEDRWCKKKSDRCEVHTFRCVYK